MVEEAVNKKANQDKLIKSCITENKDGKKVNTKTHHIYQQLTNSTATDPHHVNEVIGGNKQRAKTIILARHTMI